MMTSTTRLEITIGRWGMARLAIKMMNTIIRNTTRDPGTKEGTLLPSEKATAASNRAALTTILPIQEIRGTTISETQGIKLI